MKCVRHRCQLAPGSTPAIAFFNPSCASEITSCTPERPRATSDRKNAVQPAPSSVVNTSTPSTSRCPSTFTPVAMTHATFTIRPPSRTFWVSASTHTYVYGPASKGLVRNASTITSRDLASSLTCDLEIPSIPIVATTSSTRRVLTPST